MNLKYYLTKIRDYKKDITLWLSWVLCYRQKKWEKYICTSLFWDNVNKLETELLINIQKNIENRKFNYFFLRDEINNGSWISNIDHIILRLDMLKNSIFIEAEKWWYKLEQELKSYYVKIIDWLQSCIYWPSISETITEKYQIVRHLTTILKSHKDMFSKSEMKYLENKIDFNLEIDSSVSRKRHDDIWNIKIKDVVSVFKKVFDIYWLNWWKVVIDPTRLFVSVRWKIKNLFIPANIKSYSVKKLCELIDHEIWTHVIRWENANKTFWDSTYDYLILEEWLALMNEKLVTEEFDDIKQIPSIQHISTFIWENFNFKETEKILRIYFKSMWVNKDDLDSVSKQRALRVKNFYPFDSIGANRKDILYYRWFMALFSYYKNFINNNSLEFTKKMYFGKVWSGSLELIGLLKKEFKFDDNIIMPIWVWKLLYRNIRYWKDITAFSIKDDFRVKGTIISDDIIKKIKDISEFIKRRIY